MHVYPCNNIYFVLFLITDTCPVLCNGNGYYNEGLCQCHPGWKGQECEIPANACEVPDCNGNGECVHGQCICNNGYKGPDCSVRKYPPVNISHEKDCNFLSILLYLPFLMNKYPKMNFSSVTANSLYI